jgi:hypothetical protein
MVSEDPTLWRMLVAPAGQGSYLHQSLHSPPRMGLGGRAEKLRGQGNLLEPIWRLSVQEIRSFIVHLQNEAVQSHMNSNFSHQAPREAKAAVLRPG